MYVCMYVCPTQPHSIIAKYMQNTATSIVVGEMFICSKIGAKSFGDGSQDIPKDKESNLGPVAGFSG